MPATCRWRWRRRRPSRSAARRCCAGASLRKASISSRRGSRCSTARTARSRSSSPSPPRRPRASARNRRRCAAPPACRRRQPRPQVPRTTGAGAHRPRQGALGFVRARAPARARQRLSARGRAAVRHRRHRQRQPQEHLARAGAGHRSRPPRSRSSIAGRAKIDSLAGPLDPQLPHLRARERQDPAARGLRAGAGSARAGAHAAAAGGAGELRRAGVGRREARPLQHRRDPERHDRHRCGARQVLLPWLAATPLRIDGGHLALSYNRAARRFEIAPSVLVWGDSRVQFTGNIVHAQGPEGPGWSFDLNSAGGWIGAEPPLLPRLDLDDWSARGFFSPERGRVALSQFKLRAGGAEVSAEGDVTDMAGVMQAHLDGKIGPMPASTSRRCGPRRWRRRPATGSCRRLVRGWIQGGTFRLASGSGGGSGWAANTGPERGSLTLEGANLGVRPDRQLARARGASRAGAPRRPHLRDDRPGRHLRRSRRPQARPQGRLHDRHDGAAAAHRTVAFRGQGPLSLALEMLDVEPFQLLQKNGIPLAGIDGKVDGQLTVSMPLGQALEPRDVTVEGKTRISEGRLGHALAPLRGARRQCRHRHDHDGRGGQGRHADQRRRGRQGELAARVRRPGRQAAAAAHQRHPGQQLPQPARARHQRHGAGRRRRRGDGRARSRAGERRVHLRADLFNADVVLESVAWRKPKGRASVFEFDVVKGGATYPIELHNVRLVGDNVAIEGWMGIGADNKLKEFRFPNFSLNVVTSLETHGKVRPDGIWDVTRQGAHLRRPRPLPLLLRRRPSRRPEREGAPGPGSARRGGHGRRLFRHHAAQREDAAAEALQQADLARRARRAGGRQAVRRRGSPRARPERAGCGPRPWTPGQLFKLVGFYPNAVGGAVNLEVNLDGQGARGAHRHAVGARLPRAGRSRSSARCCRTPTAPSGRPGRAATRRARAVRVRDHARALLGRPRPVRDATTPSSTARW